MTHQPPFNRVPSLLIWRRPTALWLLPLIYLFLVTSLPLIASQSLYLFTGASSFLFALYGMSFVIGHHYFSFLHHMDRTDFYFALPGSRTKMFLSLNLGAFVYLVGPSVAVMGLNTLLRLLIAPLHTDALSSYLYLPSVSAVWGNFLSALPSLIYFFLLLEICYLLTDKSVRANAMFILINIFWPLMIFLYSDATSRFLPGFINPVAMSEPSIGLYVLIQLFSPGFSVFGDATYYFYITILMAIGLFFVALLLFKKRQAGYSPGQNAINWPFRLTEWMGVMAISLLGGYAAHLLRVETSLDRDPLLSASAVPFLIGVALGFLLSLWLFNIIRGKGKLLWKSSRATAVATIVPIAVWMAVVMTGAGGYTDAVAEGATIAKVDIHYNAMGGAMFGPNPWRVYNFTLDDPDDLALFTSMYEVTLSPDNPGLAIPRSLESADLLRDYIGRKYQTEFFDEFGSYMMGISDTHLTLVLSDGSKKERLLPLPMNLKNEDYRKLLLQNRRFYLAELADYSALGTVNSDIEVKVGPKATPDDQTKWIDPLLKMKDRDPYLFENVSQQLVDYAASRFAVSDDKVFDEALQEATILLEITPKLPRGVDDARSSFTLLLPVNLRQETQAVKIIDEALDYFDQVEDDRYS